MKRRDLVKKITESGCVLIRHGGKHDWYQNQATGICQPVPRHREINEKLAKYIIADIPDLKHCSAFGETPKKAMREILKAKEAWLESARANGKSIPLPYYRPVIYQVA